MKPGRTGRHLIGDLPREAFERETRRRDLTPEELVIDLRTNIASVDLRIRDLVIDLMTTIYPLPHSHTRGSTEEAR